MAVEALLATTVGRHGVVPASADSFAHSRHIIVFLLFASDFLLQHLCPVAFVLLPLSVGVLRIRVVHTGTRAGLVHGLHNRAYTSLQSPHSFARSFSLSLTPFSWQEHGICD